MGMLDLLRSLEWYTDGTAAYRCPSCQGYKMGGHAPDCRLDRAIRELASSEGSPGGPVCTCTGPARDAHDKDCPVRKAHPRLDLGGVPTAPSALAAWLYARVVPGQTIAESTGRRFVVLAMDMSADGQRVFLDERNGYAIPALRQHPITRLLNPDGTVLWGAK